MSSRPKRAIIVGVDGQDGTLLYEFLDTRGYTLLGVGRHRTKSNQKGYRPRRVVIHSFTQVSTLIKKFRPTEIYFLAAHHHSSEAKMEDEVQLFTRSFESNTQAPFYFLEAIRRFSPRCRFFFAASSHIFGHPKTSPQNELTPIDPRNLYGISKAASVFLCRHYREAHGIHASVGILYNHESSLRANHFLSKKLVKAAVDIAKARTGSLSLGDLNARADWGYAPDYVRAFTAILRLKQPGDYVVSTGRSYRVADFARLVFSEVGLDYRRHIKAKKNLSRAQSGALRGDSRKLRKLTGWSPSLDFPSMIKTLVGDEIERRQKKGIV